MKKRRNAVSYVPIVNNSITVNGKIFRIGQNISYNINTKNIYEPIVKIYEDLSLSDEHPNKYIIYTTNYIFTPDSDNVISIQ